MSPITDEKSYKKAEERYMKIKYAPKGSLDYQERIELLEAIMNYEAKVSEVLIISEDFKVVPHDY